MTPEYNHSIPAALKNALDSVFFSFAFRNKPALTVAYSMAAAGGVRAVEHLAQVLIEAEAVPLRNAVLIPRVTGSFHASGSPVDPGTDRALHVGLEDLAWWASVLSSARAQGSLAPAQLRSAAAVQGVGR